MDGERYRWQQRLYCGKLKLMYVLLQIFYTMLILITILWGVWKRAHAKKKNYSGA
jgi:hypothetical protein